MELPRKQPEAGFVDLMGWTGLRCDHLEGHGKKDHHDICLQEINSHILTLLSICANITK